MLDQKEKSYEILKKIAEMIADGQSIKFEQDWGFGTGTIVFDDGGHTHVGLDISENQEENLQYFIDSVYGLFIKGSGLSIVKGTESGK
jgi:hypothetical protein